MPESNHKLQRNCIAGQDAFLSELASSLVQLRELTRPVLWSLIISALLQDFLCGECVCVCVRERQRERNREKERHRYERKTLIGYLPYAPRLGIRLATLVRALTRNRTPNLLVYKSTLQPTEPHWPGPF